MINNSSDIRDVDGSVWAFPISIALIIQTLILTAGNFTHWIVYKLNGSEKGYNSQAEYKVFGINFGLESVDKLVLLLILVMFLALILVPANRCNSLLTSIMTAPVLVFSIVIAGISILHQVSLDERYEGILWFGFGPKVFLVSVLSLPVIYVLNKDVDLRAITWASIVGLPLLAYCYLPAILQPLWAIKDLYHSSFVMNEVLAPVSGIFPTSTMASTYTNLLGIPFALIVAPFNVTNIETLQQLCAAYLSLLTLATFALAVFVARTVSSRRLRPLAMFLIFPLVLVTPNGSPVGGITALFSAFPARMFPIMLTCFIIIKRPNSNNPPRLRLYSYLYGIICGFVFLNNMEFGFPTALVAIAIFLVVNQKQENGVRTTILLFFGLLTSICLFVSIVVTLDNGFNLDYFLLFTKTFGGGVFSVPMPIAGTNIIVLAVLFAGAVLGWKKLLNLDWTDTSNLLSDGFRLNAVQISAFLGAVGLMTFPYFVNRSVISSQLPIYLLLVVMILLASFSIIRVEFNQKMSYKDISKLLLIFLPQSLLIGSLMQAPDGRTEWMRLSDFNSTTYKGQTILVQKALDDAQIFLRKDIKVAVINQGNLYLDGSAVKNISLIDDPEDAKKLGNGTSSFSNLFCDHILKELNDVSDPILVENFFDEYGRNPLCPNFAELHRLSDGFSIAIVSE